MFQQVFKMLLYVFLMKMKSLLLIIRMSSEM